MDNSKKKQAWPKILQGLGLGLLILGLMAGGLCYLYWPSVTHGHLARISDATDAQLPDVVRDIPFEGPVDYAEFHGSAARYSRFLIAGHLASKDMTALCARYSLTEMPLEDCMATPPFSRSLVQQYKLDPDAFGFRCSDSMYSEIVGNTSGMPQWMIVGDYCPSSGRVVMQVAVIGK